LFIKLIEYSFVKSYANYSLFINHKGEVFMVLLVYVGDNVVASNISQASTYFKHYLNTYFSIKDLGPLRYFLSIKIALSSEGMFLCQHKYALEIIDECELLGAKLPDFPIEENHKFALAIGKVLDNATRYRRVVGCLIYLTI